MNDMNYLMCVGGTGARIGEAYVYLCAMGYVGAGTTEIWIIDRDSNNGNGKNLMDAIEEYRAFRGTCRWSETECFAHELICKKWDFTAALKGLNVNNTASFRALAGGDKNVECVMSFLHDAVSLQESMEEGFYGRASTGTAMFKALEQADLWDANSPFTSLQTWIGKRSANVPVFLVGSAFGATGASVLPNLARAIRKKYLDQKKAWPIGAELMAPYFTFNTENVTDKKVDPNTFWAKTRQALRYYGEDGTVSIRKFQDSVGGEAVLDAFYADGCETGATLTGNSPYCTGKEGQDNRSSIVELQAAMNAADFFKTGPEIKPGDSKPATYSYNTGAKAGNGWDSLDPSLKLPMISLARFCLAVLTYIYPMAHNPKPDTVDDLKNFFGVNGTPFGIVQSKVTQLDADTMQSNVTCAATFSKRFLDYLDSLVTVGPDVTLFNQDLLSDLLSELVANNIVARDDTDQQRLRKSRLNTVINAQSMDALRRSSCKLKVLTNTPGGDNTNAALHDKLNGTINLDKPPRGDYKKYTENGMKRMYQIIYEYGRNLTF